MSPAPAIPGPPLPILVVHPSAPERLLAVTAIRAALERSGRSAAIAEAASGLEALWLLARGRPAVAVVALDLPGLTGDGLVALMRARPEHRDLPVVAVAAASDPDAPERAARVGAAALLRTPFEGEAVFEALAAAGAGRSVP